MTQQSAGARIIDAGTDRFDGAGRPPTRPSAGVERPIGPWAFTGIAVTSFGGPLALAALMAPGLIAGSAAHSAGLEMLAAVVVFAVPVVIWLRYSKYVSGSGGLFAFVEAAAGRRVALVQGAIWTFSYALYVVYTTVQIVYDLLPAIFPGERRYETLLALAIPVAITAVMVAGRAATLIVLGVMAAGQLALAGALDGVTLAHLSTPASTFGAGAPAGPLTTATAQTSLLYICGSLPLFFGGELARPARTIRRGLIGAYALTALVVVLAVAPLAAVPGLAGTEVPGVSIAQQFSGRTLADAIGIGVAVSTAGVILCEYFALTRLLSAIGSWRIRPITLAIGAVVVLAAPFSLIDPDGFYNTLLKPSLIALWVSQLIVFAVYPLFARKHGHRALPAWALSLAASALALYGLWTTLHQAAS
jgi:APA family basic amino acid/polyamine antiporter